MATAPTQDPPSTESAGQKRLRALIEAQGKHPVDDLDEISARWPEGDDPDALLEFILEERRQRREWAARKS